MRIVTLAALKPLLDPKAVLACVRAALIGHAKGAFQAPMPGELIFDDPHGDCHIKFGHEAGATTFAIKVSTGFYDNAGLGLPVNNGLTLVFDASMGAPKILFQDEGWLTAWRTAAATALSVWLRRGNSACRVGVIGTGLQGNLACEWIKVLDPSAQLHLFGRNPERTKVSASNVGATPVFQIDELMSICDTIVTTTPSALPLFDAKHIRAGMHFVGVGADSPQKQELPTQVFDRAQHIFLDDRRQCQALGDFGRAVREGVVENDAGQLLGFALEAQDLHFHPDDISVVDLTGLAAQDIAIADLFAQGLTS
jgi:ornithine cyclodeaminase